MLTKELPVDTSRDQFIDITPAAVEFCRPLGDGLLSVFVPHATAGVALIEVGSGTEQDLVAAMARLLPREDVYVHHHGSVGHGADHVLPALISPSITIPVVGGRILLGTWQSIVLVDLNDDNPRRRVRLSFLPG
ncbi:MAG: secondary thiamine-phosphate synthase enzyme YjbQ [Chloroflexota bacterium]